MIPEPPPPALPQPELVAQAGTLLAVLVMGSLRAELAGELARLEQQHGADTQRISMAYALDFLAQHQPLAPERQVAIIQGRRP